MTKAQTWGLTALAMIALAAGALMMSGAVGSAQESSPTTAPSAEAAVAPDSSTGDTDTEEESADAESDSTDTEDDAAEDSERDCPEKDGADAEDDGVSTSATST